MNQSNLQRRTPLGRGKKRRLSEEEREQYKVFRRAAIGRCAACGEWPGQFTVWASAHHVVYEQHVPAELRWDPRNCLGICRDCHERHHNASRRIPLSALTEANREFASEVLGEAADDYLNRRYAA